MARGSPFSLRSRALSHDEIAARAYAIWRQRGCPPGQEAEIWLAAETELARMRRET
jgi:hypothetical protein